MKRELATLACLIGLLSPQLCQGADVWVVRVLTLPAGLLAPLPGTIDIGWRDHLIFRNTSATDLAVLGLDASNGYQMPAGETLVVPAGRTRSVFVETFTTGGAMNRWSPVAPSVLLVNRLDVPPGIVVESRCEPYGCGELVPCGGGGGGGGTDVLGSFALPVISSLTPAGRLGVHLVADLGTQTSITNVGVYNADPTQASATIEMRAACNENLIETRTVTVPPNALIYVTGFRNTYLGAGCFGGNPNAAEYLRHVIVRMDRAGFSFIATRAEAYPSRITVGSTTPR